MRRWLIGCLLVVLCATSAHAVDRYASPSGTGTACTVITTPCTLTTMIGQLVAGDTGYVRGGTYTATGSANFITLTADGTSDTNRIKLWNYPGETPILDGFSMSGSTAFGILMNNANWWHIKGLEVRGFPYAGIRLESGSGNNIIENNNVHHNVRVNGTGSNIHFDTGAGGGNLILNNDAHHASYITGSGSGGDGINVGVTTAGGNILRGNRVYLNNDDGIDLSNATGVLVEGNWIWQNGYTDSHANSTGNGAGIKMALAEAPTNDGNHDIRYNLIWDNQESGLDCNDENVGSRFYQNTVYNHHNAVPDNYNFSLWCNTPNPPDVVRNNIVLGDRGNNNWSTSPGGGAQLSNNSFIKSSGVSVNTAIGITAVDSADFVTTDFTANLGPRQADGSLPVSTFMHLASGSDLIGKGMNLGLPEGATPDLGAFQFAVAADPCDPIAVVMTGVTLDSGVAWTTPETANRFGDPADTSGTPTLSTLRLFENTTELVPHSSHSDIRTLGQGRFSHWSGDAQATQFLLWSATDNSNVTTNGRTYTYTVDCPSIRSLYHLDEAASPAVDSLEGRNGTWQNTPTPVAGKVNGALQFAAASLEYVSATSPNITEMATIAAWVRMDSLAVDYQTVVANFDAAANGAQFDLSVTGAGASQGSGAFFYGYRLQGTPNVTRQFFSAPGLITAGSTWYHLTATDDGADGITLYLNGSVVADNPAGTATAKPVSAPGALGIGRAGAFPGQYCACSVDEVHIRDSVMTPAEITALAAAGADVTPPAAPTNLRVVSP